MTETIDQARNRRLDAAVDKIIDAHIDQRLDGLKLAAPISPTAKFKLRNILKKYAKSKTPFRDCVRDNMKRFGPGRTEAVCATLKDEIKGRKDWRKGANTSEDEIVIDADVLLALDAISEVDLQEIFLEARALEQHQTVEAVALLDISGTTELTTWGNRV